MPRVIKDDSDSDSDEGSHSPAKMARSGSPSARSVGTALADTTNLPPHRMTPLIPTPTNPYPDMKEEFERTHAKVGFEYVRETFQDGCHVVERYCKSKFIDLYQQRRCIVMKSTKDGGEEEVQVSFIHKWMNDPDIQTYMSFGLYPDPGGLHSFDNKCPDGVYHLWTPFRAESIVPIPISDSNRAERVQNLASVLEHIGILSGRDRVSFDFIIWWLAQMLQYPELKSCMLGWLSKQGAGKQVITRLLESVVGTPKWLKTTKPSKDVWGEWNEAMYSAFVVELNECGMSSYVGKTGELKDLITDGVINIREKFCSTLKNFPSFHRFIHCSQVEDGQGIPTSDAERRYCIIRCSDELCSGHKCYFDHMWELIKDPVLVRDFYDFLMTRPIQKHIKGADIPITQHQRELNEVNRTPVEQWVSHFLSTADSSRLVIFVPNPEPFNLFTTFCADVRIQVQMTATSFATVLGQLKIDGVISVKSNAHDVLMKDAEKAGLRGWRFDLTTLRAGKYAEQDEAQDEPQDEPDYHTMAEAFFEEQAGRQTEAEAEAKRVQAEKEAELEAAKQKWAQLSEGGGWQTYIEGEHGISDDSKQCPACKIVFSFDISPERLVCDSCFPVEVKMFEQVLEADEEGEYDMEGIGGGSDEEDEEDEEEEEDDEDEEMEGIGGGRDEDDPYLNRIQAGADPSAGADEEEEDDVDMRDRGSSKANNKFVDEEAKGEEDDDSDEEDSEDSEDSEGSDE